MGFFLLFFAIGHLPKRANAPIELTLNLHEPGPKLDRAVSCLQMPVFLELLPARRKRADIGIENLISQIGKFSAARVRLYYLPCQPKQAE